MATGEDAPAAASVPGDATVVPSASTGVPGDAAVVPSDAAVVPSASTGVPGDTASVPSDTAGAPADPAGTQDGLLDLLGLLAYAELVAFFRLSEDAALAGSLADKAALGAMAVAEFGHFEKLRSQLTRMGGTPEQAMQPFAEPLDAFHARTAPSDWLEGLVKAYVGDGIAADFYRAVAQLLDPPVQALVMEVLADTGHAGFVIPRVRAAVAADPPVAGRLALWARRLVGEALAQAHRVIIDRPALARLLVGSAEAAGSQGDIGRMFAHLTDAHDRRMADLGLAGWDPTAH